MPEPSSEKPKRGRPKGSGSPIAQSVKRSGPQPSAAVRKAVKENHILYTQTNKEFKEELQRDLLNYWGSVKGFHFGEFCATVLGATFIIAALQAHEGYGPDAAVVVAKLTGHAMPCPDEDAIEADPNEEDACTITTIE